MKRLLLLPAFLLVVLTGFSKTILVKNIEELTKANKEAQPGDIVVLQNGEWKNVAILLNCSGTKDQPVIFKAQTPGKVMVTGKSTLKLGGNYIIVDGLNFMNGYAGDDAVFDFRIDKNQLANHCRITNCVIDDFNNPKRLDENNWVLFYGKNNQLDHCSLINKKNMGVLLAVILDDDRSRENFHSIDHNYFGVRIPLASNGGEIIRVGVSQHCQFNSNTNIHDNFFEHCDGEAEVISIKSGHNVIRGNLFKECQGSVVLRHGDYNTVENNIFLGNGKEGTGGVRVINKGQWIVNNLFYKCRGADFRSPLAIMNGIPNSPANRYVQVTEAVIANNTWYNCSPASICEGSDTERTLPPDRVLLLNNIFYNKDDGYIYRAYDNTGGITFRGNEINNEVKQSPGPGFTRTKFTVQKNDNMPFLVTTLLDRIYVTDSLTKQAKARLEGSLSNDGGFQDLTLAKRIMSNAYHACGAGWLDKYKPGAAAKPFVVNCANANQVYQQLARKEPVVIYLTGRAYELDKPFVITKPVAVTSDKQQSIDILTGPIQSAFIISGNGHLSLDKLNINGAGMKATSFISSDSSGLSDHFSLVISNCRFSAFDQKNGCENVFNACKSMVADKIVVDRCTFSGINTGAFLLDKETDNKGYYNAEKIHFTNNKVTGLNGILLAVYRGGNDESTMGPNLVFTNNVISKCSTADTSAALVQLTGVQRSNISSNSFTNCNGPMDVKTTTAAGGKLISYTDFVRASHIFQNNSVVASGAVRANKYVNDKNNIVQATSRKRD